MAAPTPPLLAGRYQLEQVLGEGARGVVASARDSRGGGWVAIKRIRRALASRGFAVRVLRELRFLRLLSGHENLVAVKDVLVPTNASTFSDTFIVFELMPCDLYRVIYSTAPLGTAHVCYLMFQLLRAVVYLHAAGVVHGSLRPSNLLVDAECRLKVCGFGLARAAAPPSTFQTGSSGNSAPEVRALLPAPCSPAVDVWACGFIFAEMLLRSPPPLQHGRSHDRASAQSAVRTALPPATDPAALQLIDAMLEVDTGRRITAREALMDEYFADLRRQFGFGPPPRRLEPRDFDFEQRICEDDDDHALASLRRELLVEICEYHPDQRAVLLAD